MSSLKRFNFKSGCVVRAKFVASYDYVKVVLSVCVTAKGILAVLHYNKTKCISFKSGCVIWVAKHLKGDWFIVLR